MNYHEMSSVQKTNYRKSGLVLAVIVTGIYALLFVRGNHQPYFVVLATIITVLALFEARPLCIVLDLMIKFGNFMHKITNPSIFALIYIFSVIPTSLALRVLGKDILNLTYEYNSSSYWNNHEKNRAWKDSFRKQY